MELRKGGDVVRHGALKNPCLKIFPTCPTALKNSSPKARRNGTRNGLVKRNEFALDLSRTHHGANRKD